MTIKEKMNSFQKTFNQIFEVKIQSIIAEQHDFHTEKTTLDATIEKYILDYARGGKRIRPFLMYLFSGKNESKETQKLGLAIELFLSLIHI